MTPYWPLKGKPFSVQSRALELSKGRDKFLYLMEQGLGKTHTTLADYIRQRDAGLVDGLAIVCPNSLKSNWQDEAKEAGANIDMALWPMKEGTDILKSVKEGFVLNYESLSNGKGKLGRGGEALMRLLTNRRIYLAFDECHRIKNADSNVGKIVLSTIIKEARFRRGSTGTPFGNSVLDLYPQLRLAGALNGVNPVTFRNMYAVLGGFKGKQITGIKEDRKEELYDLIDSYGFRATKSEWTDIPEKLYRTIRATMPDKLTKAYRDMEQDFVLMLDNEDDDAVTANMIITQLSKLQQISSGFVNDNDGKAHQIVPHRELGKFKALLDVLDANGKTSKTLVFAYFRPTVQSLMDELTMELGERPAYIVGGMSPEAIREQKALFNSDNGPQVMVLQSTAGREGHTLLGGPTIPCHTTLFYENTYDMIARVQCEDRNHRFGQKHSVLVGDFVSSYVEGLAVSALQRKVEVAADLLDKRRTSRGKGV